MLESYAHYTHSINASLFSGLLSTTFCLFESVPMHEINFFAHYQLTFLIFILLYHHHHHEVVFKDTIYIIPGSLQSTQYFFHPQWNNLLLSSFTDTHRLFILNSNRAYYYRNENWHTVERDGGYRGSMNWKKTKATFLSHSPTPRDSQEDEIIFIVFNYELILFLYIIFSYSPEQSGHTDNDININILNRK